MNGYPGDGCKLVLEWHISHDNFQARTASSWWQASVADMIQGMSNHVAGLCGIVNDIIHKALLITIQQTSEQLLQLVSTANSGGPISIHLCSLKLDCSNSAMNVGEVLHVLLPIVTINTGSYCQALTGYRYGRSCLNTCLVESHDGSWLIQCSMVHDGS